MKKLFAIIAIAALFAACNNEADNTTVTDSTTNTITTDTVPASADTTNQVTVDSMNNMDTMPH
jgi:PBP1b-binding outer membrane lipoprotein LpoB